MRRNQLVSADVQYICDLYAPEDPLLVEIRAELAKCNMEIQIGAEEGRLLQLIISLYGVKRVLEIGTLAGYSTIWMARALPENGHIVTINKDPRHIEMAGNFFAKCEYGQKITMLEGDAHKVLHTLPDGEKFDMVFIDADKISYIDYLDWVEANLPKGALIVADNSLMNGKISSATPPEGMAPTAWKNMRIFNERLADKAKYNATIIPTREGLSVAIKLF